KPARVAAVADVLPAVAALRRLLASHHLPRRRVQRRLARVPDGCDHRPRLLHLQRRPVPQIDCRNQMSKKNRKSPKNDEASERSKGEAKPKEEMSGKDYEKEVRRLHE